MNGADDEFIQYQEHAQQKKTALLTTVNRRLTAEGPAAVYSSQFKVKEQHINHYR